MPTATEIVSEVKLHVSENATAIVWKLAWPAVALNSLQVINQLLDRGFIGHLDSSAVTAHGGSINVMFMMFSLAVAVATGATALVSRAFGAENPSEYRVASHQSIRVAIMSGVVLGVITALGASFVAHLVLPSTDTKSIELMTRFVWVYATTLPPIFVIQTLAGSLRGIGDTKSPMYISGLQILTHMSFNCFLIFPTHVVHALGGQLTFTLPGANLGLVGACTSLSISSWGSAIVYLCFAKYTPLGSPWGWQLPKLAWISRILKIAIPAAMMAIVRVLSLTAFTVILAMVPNGSDAIAAMSTAFAIESIMIMPSFGLAAAAGALVGQSLGMKLPDRAERLGWTAANHGALVTLLIAMPIYMAAPGIAATMLGDKPQIIAQSVTLLRYLCATEVLFTYAAVIFGAMQGAGDTIRPMWVTVLALWGVRVPLAFVLALPAGFAVASWLHTPIGFGYGAGGAWVAMALTQGLQGVIAPFLFRQGAWKMKRV